MDLADYLKNLSERAAKIIPTLLTEEAAKNALVLPFLQALGYDVFNPTEVQPEYTTDIGTKKGERVDYAILIDGKPVILIEAKPVTDKLDKADGQLLRYFHVSEAKFGILTNGVDYKFYTDLVDSNKMDEKPFLQINLLNLKEQDIIELKKFSKSFFNVDAIFSTASELKYLNEIKSLLTAQTESPSEDFVRYFIHVVHTGKATEKIIEQFKGIVKKALNQFTSEIVSNRLKTVLEQERTEEKHEAEKNEKEEAAEINEITNEELESYFIIKGIVRQKIDASRVFYRKSQSYVTIIVDDNNRKPICRLWFNAKKHISLFDGAKKETKVEFETLDDIYKFTQQLQTTAELHKDDKF